MREAMALAPLLTFALFKPALLAAFPAAFPPAAPPIFAPRIDAPVIALETAPSADTPGIPYMICSTADGTELISIANINTIPIVMRPSSKVLSVPKDLIEREMTEAIKIIVNSLRILPTAENRKFLANCSVTLQTPKPSARIPTVNTT
jgi:hypothetical protein